MKKSTGTAIAIGALLWIIILGASYYHEIQGFSDRPLDTDFYKFHLSAQSVLAGQSPYWSAPQKNDPASHCYRPVPSDHQNQAVVPEVPPGLHPGHQQCINPNLNPPVFIAATLPLGAVEFTTGWWLWSVLSILAGIGAVYVLVKEGVPKGAAFRWWYMLLAIPALFTYYPVRANIQLGQVGLFLMLVLVLAWRDLRNGRDFRAGILLGIAASIKLFAGLFILALLVDRRWKASGAFVVSCAVMALLGYAALGSSAYIDYQSALSDTTWYASNWNASIKGLFSKWLGGANTPGFFELPEIGSALTIVVSLLVIVVMLQLIQRLNRPSPENVMVRSDMLCALTLVSMLLLSPLGWMYYLPVLAIAVLVVLKYSVKLTLQSVGVLGPLVFVLLTVFPFSHVRSDVFVTVVDWWWSGVIYSYALLIIFMSVIYVVVIKSR